VAQPQLPVGDADEPQAAGVLVGPTGSARSRCCSASGRPPRRRSTLAEVAGRHGEPDFRSRLTEHNATHNAGLNRTALKMATGSGKTIVMGMLIAWQTINKSATPRDARFANRFLIVTPGITIRDRLRVLQPSEDVNYYDQRDLVPPSCGP
jgi:hypothetical protein